MNITKMKYLYTIDIIIPIVLGTALLISRDIYTIKTILGTLLLIIILIYINYLININFTKEYDK